MNIVEKLKEKQNISPTVSQSLYDLDITIDNDGHHFIFFFLSGQYCCECGNEKDCGVSEALLN